MHRILENIGGVFNHISLEAGRLSRMTNATEVTLTLDSITGKYYLEGESIQNGTPTPENPIEIVNTYKAGHYITTIGGTTYRFSLGDDLRSIGDTKDKFELDITNRTASVTKNIGNVILNGSETFDYSVFNNFDNFKCNIINMAVDNTGFGICSHYKNRRIDWLDEDGVIRFGWNNNIIYLYNDYERFNSNVNIFKNWLSNNNIKVYYQLETPTTESVEVD